MKDDLGASYAWPGLPRGGAVAQTQPSLTGNPPQFYTYLAPAKTIDASHPRPSVPLPPGLIRIFDGKTLKGWRQDPAASWMVSRGIIGSLGVGRGVLFTEKQYRHYRIVFDVRHVSGDPDHQACVLFFGLMPHFDRNAPDMLKAIQFQVPLARHLGTIAMAITPTGKGPAETEIEFRDLRALRPVL